MKKIFEWLNGSNRWKHLVGGLCIGLGAEDWYCAEYAGFGIAGSLEMKDKLWGGEPDWIDFLITVVGVNVGYCTRMLIFK